MFEMSTFDDVAVVHLSGEVSQQEILELGRMLGKLMTTSKLKVVLNFKEVEHVDYKSISKLLERVMRLRSLNGDLKFASLSAYTRDIFRFTGVAQVVEAYDSVYDAIMSFNGAPERHRTWH